MYEAKPKSASPCARKWPAILLIVAIVTVLATPAFAGEEGEIDPVLITSPTPVDDTGSGAETLLRSLKARLCEILVESHAPGLYGWLFSTLPR